jgi:hypothetical protein
MGQILGVEAALFTAMVIILVVYYRRRTPKAPSAAKLESMRLEVNERRDELTAELLRAAAATGKPRGLRWTECDLSGEPHFAIDPKSRLVYALIAVTISFEAIEGGGMEDVEAVGNLRSATAVFVNRGGRWTTEGRVLFNLEPAEALDRLSATLQPLTPG